MRLPLLRKDFIVDRLSALEARAAGADAVLLIVAALDDDGAASAAAARRAALGLDVLVEVHDEAELGRALDAGADLIGVNNRNLRTLAVDIDASRRLARAVAAGRLAVGGERPEDGGGSRALCAPSAIGRFSSASGS